MLDFTVLQMSKTNREKGYYALFNMPFAAKLFHLASRVSGWTLNGTWSFLKLCLQASIGSLSRE